MRSGLVPCTETAGRPLSFPAENRIFAEKEGFAMNWTEIVVGAIVSGLIATGITFAVSRIAKKRHALRIRYETMMRRFFHSEKTVSELIFSFDDTKIRNDEFIRYRDVIDGNLYPGTDIRMTVHRNREQRTFTLPYEEVVDFTLRPHTGISTDGDIPVRYPDDGITECTRPGLDAYLKRNPATYNDRILCMRYLERTEEDGYRCGLTQSDFLDVVRTNLTLDYPLKGSFRETLRQTDSAQRPGTLPSLAASRMMNFIGVSAVWCMDCGSGSFETRYRYYLKCRQTGMSVYSDMLGTTSGYANPPKFASAETAPTCKETDSSAGIPNADTRQGLASGDLLAYLCEEMKREFFEETGYDRYAAHKGLSLSNERILKVIPLAFTRELARGGTPQFFFLILTPYITDKEFVKYFRQSVDGRNEFRDNTLSNLRNHPLSPETLANLLYAYKYIRKMPSDRILL